MNALLIEKKSKTLKVVLDKKNNLFLFEGKSLPENTLHFFEPVMNWLTEYKQSPTSETIVKMDLIYFNTSSAKFLLEILRKFESIYNSGKQVKVIWYYMFEDVDILEAGMEYSSMVSLPFEFIEHPPKKLNSELKTISQNAFIQ